MWWLEPSVRVELGIVKDQVERTVPQRTAGRIEIKFRQRIRFGLRQQSIRRVEMNGVETLRERSAVQLLMQMCFAEDMNVVVHSSRNPNCANVSGRMSISRCDC